MKVLGIDIGGSGIKGAPVNTKKGKMRKSRFRISTPDGAMSADVAAVVNEIAQHFKWKGPIGCGFPAVIQRGFARTAANVDDSWIGKHADKLFSDATGCPVKVVNDADAAGLAEMRFGAGKGQDGLVFIVTIGTGLGTAMFTDGVLVPNTELGHIELDGFDAESRASDAARKNEDLSWEEWAARFDHYLGAIEKLFWPDLFIIGGGASKKFAKFYDLLSVKAEVVPALLKNEAGIIGAALAGEKLK
ncbi:MAG: ROK family protein [Anaerolineae bacterium]|nr:ROK family protein [Anaerolineae bacterium]